MNRLRNFVPIVREETSETEYYEELSTDDNQISQQQMIQSSENVVDELNALVPPTKNVGFSKPYGGVSIQKRPDSSVSAKEPAACWEFSVYSRCARGGRCTFSHKAEHCSKFLEEIMTKGADRLKVLKGK